MNNLEQQNRIELARSPEAIPGGDIWSERLTEAFEKRARTCRMKSYATYEELVREGIGAKRLLHEGGNSTTQIEQLDGIIREAHDAYAQYSEKIERARGARVKGGEEMKARIESIETEIVNIQKLDLSKEEKQTQVKGKIEELQGLAQELPLSLSQKDTIREVSDRARSAVELQEVQAPLIKGVQSVLKYIESENLLDERDDDLEMWKNRNLVHVEQLKMLYGGRFPDALPAHLGYLLMNMDTRLDQARSMVGRTDTFQFALKRYSTLVNHFGELVEEVTARVEIAMPGMIERVTGLLQEKQRIQGSLIQIKPEQKEVAQNRIDEINKDVAELQGRLRASVEEHVRQLPPPEAELIPHKQAQWGPYLTEEEAKNAIEALFQANLPDTIWLEELGQVKALVEFYQNRKPGLPDEMQQKVDNKIRYFSLKFTLLRDKLIAGNIISEGMAGLDLGPPPEIEELPVEQKNDETIITSEGELESSPQDQEETTQPRMMESPLESEEIGLDEEAQHEPGEVVYVHRPTGERFIIDTTYNHVALPSPPQMMISRERLIASLPIQDLQKPEKVEAAVELLLKRRDEEIRLMKDLITRGPFEVIQEILHMPFSDFENQDQFTSEVGAYMKQEGIKINGKSLKYIHEGITTYLAELGYKATADGRLVGEVLSDGIKFRLST